MTFFQLLKSLKQSSSNKSSWLNIIDKRNRLVLKANRTEFTRPSFINPPREYQVNDSVLVNTWSLINKTVTFIASTSSRVHAQIKANLLMWTNLHCAPPPPFVTMNASSLPPESFSIYLSMAKPNVTKEADPCRDSPPEQLNSERLFFFLFYFFLYIFFNLTASTCFIPCNI